MPRYIYFEKPFRSDLFRRRINDNYQISNCSGVVAHIWNSKTAIKEIPSYVDNLVCNADIWYSGCDGTVVGITVYYKLKKIGDFVLDENSGFWIQC